MIAYINRLRYNTKEAIHLADDQYIDNSKRCTDGRNIYLFKTRKGRFFKYIETFWEGERDEIIPISIEEAKDLFEVLGNHEVSWEYAFREKLEDA